MARRAGRVRLCREAGHPGVNDVWSKTYMHVNHSCPISQPQAFHQIQTTHGRV